MSDELVKSPEVKQLRDEATGLLEIAESFVVNADTFDEATDLLGWIAGAKKKLEEQRVFFVKPLNDQVKKINERFKSYAAPLEQADQVVRGKVLGFRQEAERQRREEEARLRRQAEAERARLAAEAAAQDLPEPPPPPIPVIPRAPKTVRSNMGTATVKKVWDFEVLDERQVPREFLIVNEKAIRAAVKAGVRNIPGVQIFETEQLAVRAN